MTLTEEDSLAILLRRVHGRFAQYFNARRARCGHLWQNRFFSCPMGPGHLWTAIRYVESNPVRAGLAAAVYRIEQTCNVYSALGDAGGWHRSFYDAAGPDLCPASWVEHYDPAQPQNRMTARRWTMPRALRPAIAGLMVGCPVLVVPGALGTGYGFVQSGLDAQSLGQTSSRVRGDPSARVVPSPLTPAQPHHRTAVMHRVSPCPPNRAAGIKHLSVSSPEPRP